MSYVPDRGNIVWLTFNPQAGSEHAGRRPAIVLSPSSYNGKVGLAIFCPITSQIKGYPFEVALPKDLPVIGVVLSDQVKSLDWRSRNAQFACQSPQSVITEVLQKLSTLVAISLQ
ncbi:endoribonuclease MazF [Candidatus Chloroploca sp. Khr17]|uniref:endoribonuclease MazF n=1 Tax=Candidatus Chloroploca sp. Khr17 TaxID=2496869 RepID=UPI00101C21FE|nr:endoribonuclease MazF [Candidatus Chloroploca sp. Khr17]